MSKAVHSFVLPAYGRSPHLRECLQSLAAQSRRSPIVVSTSTPFDGIADLCREFDAELVCHGPNRGIGPDWNAALAVTGSSLVTLAHQDDIYAPVFAEHVTEAYRRKPDSVLLFTNAEEVTHDGRLRRHDFNNRIKQVMVGLAFAGRHNINDPISKRILLGMGNPIVCPAVTFNRDMAPQFRFREDLRTNMDWIAWVELAAIGPITRFSGKLVRHRVHNDSETARCLDDGARRAEDLMVFQQLWPTPVARLLSRLYSRSYAGYSE